MKASLAYKIFGAFLLTSLTIATLTIGSLRVFAHRNFENYVNKIEMEKLSELVDDLIEEYQNAGGWGRLHEDPLIWRRMVRGTGHGPPAPPGAPREDHNNFDKQHKEGVHPGSPPPRLHPRRELLDFQRRIFLLDAQRQPIAGNLWSSSASVLEITVDAKIIGYLGINKEERRFAPPEIAFLRGQNELFYLIGAGIFILTGFVSFFLSRHLLAPIKQLTDGTRALVSRKLTTRIDVRSRDELGQLAADFNVMAHTLEQYEEMRKQWISDISHELRTPMSILRGEIEAMQDGVRKVDRQALDSLYSEVLHLGKIVDDLHELSLADTGALHLDRRPIDPIQVLKDTLTLFRTRFDHGKIAVHEDLQIDQEVKFMGDSNRLAQLYSNILENTLRYADAPGRLEIFGSLSEKELILSFEDSGPGVPEESVNRLFDRLYRVDSARTRGKGGSGLGLAICRAIVESHGGTISAANAPSGGLRIHICLPLNS